MNEDVEFRKNPCVPKGVIYFENENFLEYGPIGAKIRMSARQKFKLWLNHQLNWQRVA